jgi:hypothetical protein
MEQETDLGHLLTHHQFALFIIGAVLLLLVIFGIGKIFGIFSSIKRDDKNGD